MLDSYQQFTGGPRKGGTELQPDDFPSGICWKNGKNSPNGTGLFQISFSMKDCIDSLQICGIVSAILQSSVHVFDPNLETLTKIICSFVNLLRSNDITFSMVSVISSFTFRSFRHFSTVMHLHL